MAIAGGLREVEIRMEEERRAGVAAAFGQIVEPYTVWFGVVADVQPKSLVQAGRLRT